MAKKKVHYKVWVEVEELDEKGDTTGDSPPLLPDCVGKFKTIPEAAARQLEIATAFGIDPEHSDAPGAARKVYYDGAHCPNCGSGDISAINRPDPCDTVDAMFQHIQCLDCGANWTDEFRLVGFDDLIVPKGARELVVAPKP
jgi:Zn ribbon nucleic-acid-binding protein